MKCNDDAMRCDDERNKSTIRGDSSREMLASSKRRESFQIVDVRGDGNPRRGRGNRQRDRPFSFGLSTGRYEGV